MLKEKWMEISEMNITYHGTKHSGNIDRISPAWAVFARVFQTFWIHIQNPQADIQDSTFKLRTKKQVSQLISCLSVAEE